MPMRQPHEKQALSYISSSNFSETPRHFSAENYVVGFSPSPVLNDEVSIQRAKGKPATLALMLQLGALLITLALWLWIEQSTTLDNNLYAMAIFQGCMAMLLAIAFRMDAWWRVIQFVFPVGLLAMHNLALPSWFYFVGFIFTLSLFWTTFRTQVPFYPSRPDVWHRVAGYLPKDRPVHLIDIGSGLGDLVMYLARAKPDSRFFGIEIAPLPWLLSRWRAKANGIDNARFVLGNYEALDFAQFDVVFAYLSPAAMEALWQKASAGMKPGSQLMSYEFGVPGVEPDNVLSSEGRPPIYVWQF